MSHFMSETTISLFKCIYFSNFALWDSFASCQSPSMSHFMSEPTISHFSFFSHLLLKFFSTISLSFLIYFTISARWQRSTACHGPHFNSKSTNYLSFLIYFSILAQWDRSTACQGPIMSHFMSESTIVKKNYFFHFA
jgi:hypothetical protein